VWLLAVSREAPKDLFVFPEFALLKAMNSFQQLLHRAGLCQKYATTPDPLHVEHEFARFGVNLLMKSRWIWIAVLALSILVGLVSRRWPAPMEENAIGHNPPAPLSSRGANSGHLGWRARHGIHPEVSAEAFVAGLVNHFGRTRRDLARVAGLKAGKEIPPEVEKFFDAIEAGNWEEIERSWTELRKRSGRYEGTTLDPAFDPFWPAVLDAFGVAEQAHMWPAEQLLDYGYSILDSLRPGMVYVGGTDPGRWIPEMINESLGGESHIIVTQNAFADSTYLGFVNQMYGDRMATLTEEDSKKAFQEYVEDAQRRWEHDQNFPDEPKQVNENENLKMVNGKFEVGGQGAVMAINEKLFRALVEKNPDLSFGIEHSFPFKTTFGASGLLGPIMEVNAGEEALTQKAAEEAVEYWRGRSADILEGLQEEKLRMAHAKLAANQAELLLARNFPNEAEQTFRIAAEMAPTNPEALFGYANFLSSRGRGSEAIPFVERAIAANPEKQRFRDLLVTLQKNR